MKAVSVKMLKEPSNDFIWVFPKVVGLIVLAKVTSSKHLLRPFYILRKTGPTEGTLSKSSKKKETDCYVD